MENPEMNHLTFFTSLDWNPNCIRQCNYVTVEEFNPVKMLIDEIIMINVAAAGDVGAEQRLTEEARENIAPQI